LEEYSWERNCLGVQFDERGKDGGGAKQAMSNDELAYTFASGKGTARSKVVANSLPSRTWAGFGISNGENPIDGFKPDAFRQQGEQVRMIAIPVPGGTAGGIFNCVEGNAIQVVNRARKLAEQVEETIAQHHGVAMPRFLENYVPKAARCDARTRQIMAMFAQHVGATTSPWERRFAEKFGAVLAAAIFSAEMGIAPWDRKRACMAIKALYTNARASIVSLNDATSAFVATLTKRAKSEKRFPTVNKGDHLTSSRKATARGAKVTAGKRRHVLVPLARVKKMVKPAAATDSVLRFLADERIVLRDSENKITQQRMIKALTGSDRNRYVVFDLKALKARR
jgi:hypothetical protein